MQQEKKIYTKLDTESMKEGFFSECALIGFLCGYTGYHLCWQIEQHLGMRFFRNTENTLSYNRKEQEENRQKKPKKNAIKSTDILFAGQQDSSTFFFPSYDCLVPGSTYRYTLYRLKSQTEHLLPEISHLDYICLVQTDYPEVDAELLSEKLQAIPGIQLVQVLQAGDIKNIENLIV